MEETWKDIPCYEGFYQASDLGRIRSVNRYIQTISGYSRIHKGRILKHHCDKDGYERVVLSRKGTKTFHTHRLIALTFVPNPDGKTQVNHKDGNIKNNAAENLEWCSLLENIRHAWKVGLSTNAHCFGELHYKHKLTEENVMYIRTHYKPKDERFGAKALSKLFGVSYSAVWKIISKESWKHVKED